MKTFVQRSDLAVENPNLKSLFMNELLLFCRFDVVMSKVRLCMFSLLWLHLQSCVCTFDKILGVSKKRVTLIGIRF